MLLLLALARGADAHVDDGEALGLSKRGLEGLGQLVVVGNMVPVSAKGLSHLFVPCRGVQRSDRNVADLHIRRYLFNSAVDTVVIEDNHDKRQVLACGCLDFHRRETEGRISHNGHHRLVGEHGLGRKGEGHADSHGAEGASVQPVSWLVVADHSPSNIHGVGALTDQNKVLGQVLLDYLERALVLQGQLLVVQELFAHLAVLLDLAVQRRAPGTLLRERPLLPAQFLHQLFDN